MDSRRRNTRATASRRLVDGNARQPTAANFGRTITSRQDGMAIHRRHHIAMGQAPTDKEIPTEVVRTVRDTRTNVTNKLQTQPTRYVQYPPYLPREPDQTGVEREHAW